MNTVSDRKRKPRFGYVLMGFALLFVLNLQCAAAYDGGDFKDDFYELGKTIILPTLAIAGVAFIIGKVLEAESYHWVAKVIMTLFLFGFIVGACKMYPDPIGSTFDKVWGAMIFWD